jgi:hypothetical protein
MPAAAAARGDAVPQPEAAGRGDAMKEYRVEALVYYTKLTIDKEHIIKSSVPDIQEKLDQYARDGWHLLSTNATDFGFAVYFYLYFERDAR